jgi:hypothetical protein
MAPQLEDNGIFSQGGLITFLHTPPPLAILRSPGWVSNSFYTPSSIPRLTRLKRSYKSIPRSTLDLIAVLHP